MGRLKKDAMQSAVEALSSAIIAARLNDTVVISDLRKTTEAQDITAPRARLLVEYDVPDGITAITKVELLGNNNVAMTTAAVNVRVMPPMVMKHILYAQEGGVQNG